MNGDWKQVGIGEPNDPIIGDKAKKGRRWKIDPYGSGKSFSKITHPTKPSKSLTYTEFYKEIVEPARKEDVSKRELNAGIKSEMEHTDSVRKAAKIALTHLAEDPHYYSKLKAAGLYERIKEVVSSDNPDDIFDDPNSKACGIEEFMTFYNIANDNDIHKVDLLMKSDKIREAWRIVIEVLKNAGKLNIYKLEENAMKYKDFYAELNESVNADECCSCGCKDKSKCTNESNEKRQWCGSCEQEKPVMDKSEIGTKDWICKDCSDIDNNGDIYRTEDEPTGWDECINEDELPVNNTDHTIDDDHTTTAIRPLNKQSQSPLAIGESGMAPSRV